MWDCAFLLGGWGWLFEGGYACCVEGWEEGEEEVRFHCCDDGMR
jgi:hypothetical protein